MEVILTDMVSGLLSLLALGALAGTTVVALYLAYWWALHYGFISFTNDGRLSLKPKHLPPGSMGLPVIGQNLLFRKNMDEFYETHFKRYGEIYKTHIMGTPMVVATTPSASKELLISCKHNLKGSAHAHMPDLLGTRFISFEEGEMHTLLKKLLMKHLQPEALKPLVPEVEQLSVELLNGWGNESKIIFMDEIERLTLAVGMLTMLGPLSTISAAKLNDEFTELEKGFSAPAINKPGYQYHRSLQARERFINELDQIMKARKLAGGSDIHGGEGHSNPKDILDSLIGHGTDTNQDPLPRKIIEDNVLGFLFASNRTTSGLVSFTLKYLHDNPDVLRDVKAEQESIRERKGSDEALSWEDLKDMTFTYQVMQESLRMSNVIGIQYKVVEQEFDYKGYVIPKGWVLITSHRQWHNNPEFYPDPEKFDPSRFQTPKKGIFTPFGIGHHLCAGYELVRVELLVFLHHLTTKFSWEIIKDGPTQMTTFIHPYARLPLKLLCKSTPSQNSLEMATAVCLWPGQHLNPAPDMHLAEGLLEGRAVEQEYIRINRPRLATSTKEDSKE